MRVAPEEAHYEVRESIIQRIRMYSNALGLAAIILEQLIAFERSGFDLRAALAIMSMIDITEQRRSHHETVMADFSIF